MRLADLRCLTPLRLTTIAVLMVVVRVGSAASQGDSGCLGNVGSASSDSSAEQSWECTTEAADTRVCRRAIPGSDIREVMAKAVIKALPEQVFSVISDYQRYPQFMPYVTASEIVKDDAGELWVFQQLGFPWPISDHYYTIRLVTDTTCSAKGFYQVKWSLVSEGSTIRKGMGEPTLVNTGSWDLQPIDAGAHTNVTYFIHTNPGGALPVWVINMANKVAVPKVIKAVRHRVSKTNEPD